MNIETLWTAASIILNWPPRFLTLFPQCSHCVISRTVNLIDFTSMIELCYMSQSVLRKAGYPAGPDLISSSLKEEFSPVGSRRQRHSKPEKNWMCFAD